MHSAQTARKSPKRNPCSSILIPSKKTWTSAPNNTPMCATAFAHTSETIDFSSSSPLTSRTSNAATACPLSSSPSSTLSLVFYAKTRLWQASRITRSIIRPRLRSQRLTARRSTLSSSPMIRDRL